MIKTGCIKIMARRNGYASDHGERGRGNAHQENKRKTGSKKHLENLGFVVGGKVTVIKEIAGNLIVNVRNSRVAISREMACRILV
jgi:FeoA domain.